MRSSKSEAHEGARPAFLSPQPVILGVVLVILLAMLAVALQPGFRGGGYLTSILAIGIALVGVVFVRTATGRSLVRDEGDDDIPLKMSDSGDVGWGAMRRAALVLGGLFVAALLLGMVVGLTLAAFVILTLQMKMPVRAAAVLTLIWGVVIPVAFGILLQVAIWPGLIPELVPGWIGGGLLPPL